MNDKPDCFTTLSVETSFKQEKLNPFFVGLFWFSADYSSLVRTIGIEKEKGGVKNG